MKQWICSDTHFGHKNIIIYEPKRFEKVLNILNKSYKLVDELRKDSIEEYVELYKSNELFRDLVLSVHDKMLIDIWNSTVKSDDMVYFLGDFTLTRNKEVIEHLCKALNGRKILIMGNHDTRKPKEYVELGFEQATKRPLILPRNKKNVILSHEPPIDDDLDNTLGRHGEDDEDYPDDLNNCIRWNPYDVFLFGHVHSDIASVEIHDNVKCICLDRNDLNLFDLDSIVKELCR